MAAVSNPIFALTSLALSLSVFWISSNNLIELPQSFVDMKCLDDMKIEYNPMQSPPMELVQEGMQTVMQYCRIRASRINELAELLEDVGFETTTPVWGRW